MDLCEPVSALSHLVAAVVAVLVTPLLLRRARGHLGHTLAVGVYCFSLVFLLAMSGLYHAQDLGLPSRPFFRRLDHAGIWILIAGCFTPVHAILFEGRWRWVPLGIVWSAAAVGVALKLWVPLDAVPRGLNFALYTALSGFGVVSVVELARRHGAALVRALLLCGAIYGAGAVCFFLQAPRELVPGLGHHELWHFAVVLGAACHWWFVYRIGPHHRAPLAAREGAPAPALAAVPAA